MAKFNRCYSTSRCIVMVMLDRNVFRGRIKNSRFYCCLCSISVIGDLKEQSQY